MTKTFEWPFLGKKCNDIVSGAEGIATSVTEWMYGCRQYKITATDVAVAPADSIKHYFYEGQLEEIGPGITDKVAIPIYEEPSFFGMECKDKVTGMKGICIGRYVSLFNCDQYVLEYQPEDLTKDARILWLDEGRIEVISDSENNIDPADVQNSRAGGIMPSKYYPSVKGFINLGI